MSTAAKYVVVRYDPDLGPGVRWAVNYNADARAHVVTVTDAAPGHLAALLRLLCSGKAAMSGSYDPAICRRVLAQRRLASCHLGWGHASMAWPSAKGMLTEAAGALLPTDRPATCGPLSCGHLPVGGGQTGWPLTDIS